MFSRFVDKIPIHIKYTIIVTNAFVYISNVLKWDFKTQVPFSFYYYRFDDRSVQANCIKIHFVVCAHTPARAYSIVLFIDQHNERRQDKRTKKKRNEQNRHLDARTHTQIHKQILN